MIFKGNSLFESSKITREIIDILSEEYRFETIKLSMPDMITCHIHGSKYLPKATSVDDSPMILCLFTIYNNSIVFGVSCFEAKNSGYIIDRLNNELPYLKEPISKNINKIATLVHFNILNEIKTWKRRGDIPPYVFHKIGGSVYVKTDAFND